MRCLEKDPAARWQSAEELLAGLEVLATPASGVPAADHRAATVRRRRALIAGVVLVATALLGYWYGPRRQGIQRRWARDQGIPRLLALAERGQWDSAFILARRVEAVNPRDSQFRSLRPTFARRISLRTDPPGAMVMRKEYSAPDSDWMFLGTTPLDSVLMA
jgi:hypothetical protein